MKKLILTMMVFAVLVSCDDKDKAAAKKEVQKAEQAVEKTADKAADAVKKAGNKVSDLFKDYKTKSGKSFTVDQEGEGSMVNVKITPKGFEVNEPIVLKDVDPVSKVFMADLNKDGFEEIYVVTNSAGSGTAATLYAYVSNRDKSVTPVYVQEVTEKDLKGAFKGYMGHDTFYVENGRLYRKFPVYKEGDSNANPTGGEKVIEYVLKPGEASWQLVVK